MQSALYIPPGTSPEREEFYGRLAQHGMAPLWESLARLVGTEPRPSCVPAVWRYDELRPLVMESGKIITAEEAERRVLMLLNPGLNGQAQITNSLYAGLQLVLPGEVTPTHRHVASALRFIIEGTGAYTSVNGQRITMHPGDFILTPSWTYHDHGNPSQEPVVWLDGLDIPIINMFDTSFAEHHPDGTQALTDGESEFAYPYARSREQLEILRRQGPIEPRYGFKLEFKGRAHGGYPLTNIAAFLQLLPKGFRGKPSRATDATIFCAVEGQGQSHIGTTTIAWKAHDVFCAPSWTPVSHECDAESVLFSFSDRPVQQALGLWREHPAVS
jgi:gentisate 1,2-dioxygenase